MYVKEIWRYPVKSMRGELLSASGVLKTGVVGDRQIVVVSAVADRLITARTHPGLLGLQASVGVDGTVTIDGLFWNTEKARRHVSAAAREQIELVDLGEDTNRFDVLPLLVATVGAIEDLGLDSRRLRLNIIIGGVKDQLERSWPGHTIRIGALRIEVAQLRMRCVMTTFDPDTLLQDRQVLRRIVEKVGGKTALDCVVSAAGNIRINDPVSISP